MRTELARLAGVRQVYTATFACYGRSHLVERGQHRPRRGCALLRDVRTLEGDLVAQHVWVNETGEMIALGVREGNRLAFSAVAAPYQKAIHSPTHETSEDHKLVAVLEVSLC